MIDLIKKCIEIIPDKEHSTNNLALLGFSTALGALIVHDIILRLCFKLKGMCFYCGKKE